jgi:hypothetical protein
MPLEPTSGAFKHHVRNQDGVEIDFLRLNIVGELLRALPPSEFKPLFPWSACVLTISIARAAAK